MVKEPEFQVTPKEFDLLKWGAKQNMMEDVGAFTRKVVLDYCKDLYLRKKKAAEEKQQKKEESEELERQELMKELEDSGELELRDKYKRDRRTKEQKEKGQDKYNKEKDKEDEIFSDPDVPVMEGQIERTYDEVKEANYEKATKKM